MDDLGKQFEEFSRRTKATLRPLPLLVANEGRNFFLDRFKTQDWVDTRTEPWKSRKPNAKRNKGRAILTDTGKGKRSIRVMQADWSGIKVGVNDPTIQKYMAAHNTGFRGIVNVPEHQRIATRKVGTRMLKLRGKQKRERVGGNRMKIRGRGHTVKAHTKKMNLPRRKFIGPSHYLNTRINRLIINQLNKI